MKTPNEWAKENSEAWRLICERKAAVGMILTDEIVHGPGEVFAPDKIEVRLKIDWRIGNRLDKVSP